MSFLSSLRKVRRPKTDEFSQEVLSHVDVMYAVALRMTRNPADAEDLVQEAIFKAIRGRDQFMAGTSMKAWLLRIVTNSVINKYRRGTKERDVMEGPDAKPLSHGWVSAASMQQMVDPETHALRPMFEREVSKALDELPEDFRLVVILSDVEDCSYKEIAEIAGCPVGTVMSRLHRGRRMLQERLYDQAVSMGIVQEKPNEGSENAKTFDLSDYRARRQGVG